MPECRRIESAETSVDWSVRSESMSEALSTEASEREAPESPFARLDTVELARTRAVDFDGAAGCGCPGGALEGAEDWPRDCLGGRR